MKSSYYYHSLFLIEQNLNRFNFESLQFPQDVDDHYHNLLQKTTKYRNIAIHSHSAFQGPWLENHFISHFINKPLSYFSGLVPLFIQWTDLHVKSMTTHKPQSVNNRENPIPISIPIPSEVIGPDKAGPDVRNVSSADEGDAEYGNMLKEVEALLRPDVLYVVVHQA